jgi:hypothetical protein
LILRICTIDGQEVWIAKNWRISSRYGSIASFDCDVIDLKDLESIRLGQEIIFRSLEDLQDYDIENIDYELIDDDIENGKLYTSSELDRRNYGVIDEIKTEQISYTTINLIFAYSVEDTLYAGIIDDVEMEDPNNFLVYKLKCDGYVLRATKRVVPFSVKNQTAGDIIKNNILPILQEEGISEGEIQDGDTLKKVVSNYNYVNQILDKIKNLTGYIWDIDFEKKLNFFDRATYNTPFNITNGVQHSDFRFTKNKDNYRNVQYLVGGQGKTDFVDPETLSPSPDGVIRTFVTRFPLAQQPTVLINDIPVPNSDVGVNGLDTNRKFYWSYNSNIISQDFSEAPLTVGTTIKLDYVGLYPLGVSREDNNEIDRIKDIETDTSGRYENVTSERGLEDRDEAIDFADKLLDRYAKITGYVTFNTVIPNLKVGQLLTVDKPLYGIDDKFLIQSIDVGDRNGIVTYSVKALSGEAVGGWEDFFRKLVEGNQRLSISEDEIIVFSEEFSEETSYNGEITIKIYDDLPTLPVELSFTLGTLTDEVILND